jgi:hypothetical protein
VHSLYHQVFEHFLGLLAHGREIAVLVVLPCCRIVAGDNMSKRYVGQREHQSGGPADFARLRERSPADEEIKLDQILANHLDNDSAMKPVCNLD